MMFFFKRGPRSTSSLASSSTSKLLLHQHVISLFAVISCFSTLRLVSSQETYTCPGLSSDPIVVSAPGPSSSVSTFTRNINKSTSGTMCTLIRVTPKSDRDVNMNSITRNSKNDDFDIVPVARSYNNQKWERVAGPYAQDLEVSNCCSLAIPNLNVNNSGSDDNGRFLLMSFSHNLSEKEEVSRFFQQTTFGPTLDMINLWNYGNSNIQHEMGDWIKKQMDEDIVVPTYHRAFYRQRLDFSFYQETISANARNNNARPRHPCARYSRWRPFSFTNDDYYAELNVSRWNGRILLRVNNIPRTVVSSFQDRDGANIGTGTYRICWGTEEMVNGYFGIEDPISQDCIWSYNPEVDLPNGVITSDIRQVNFPISASFGMIEKILMPNQEEEYFGEAAYLKSSISTGGCDSILANGSYDNILGTLTNGQQGWYAGHLELDENTLENPIADAGAAMMKIVDLLGVPSDSWRITELCPVASKSFLNMDACYLSTNIDACSSTYLKQNDGDAVLVCGSPGEEANNPLERNTYTHLRSNQVNLEWQSQKKNIWSVIALESSDQLRQRMAWALSQILIVTPNQIEEEGYSEIYLNYYDIFVRNAFGNYFDILKEVSYSPMMAEMLSYLSSKSAAYVLEDTGANSYPDENFAREIMQLFSIGIYELNIDGTRKLDSSGSPILAYDNTDIQNFARAWTGFIRQPRRSNIEMMWWDSENRMDPMKIQGVYRDPFPKMNLYDGFIGDKVPLCVDLPEQHFLRKGATYRLLGSSLTPEMHEYPSWWGEDRMPDNVFILTSSSNLKSALSSKQARITLNADIACISDECNVDTMRLVQIQQNPPLYYEYVRPQCVELSFYDNGKKISTDWSAPSLRKSMCANQNIDAAYDACCANPSWAQPNGSLLCYYDLERTTYSTSRSRCKSEYPDGDTCDHYWTTNDNECTTADYWMPDNWFWTNQDCVLKAKVNEEGNVAIVHQPTLLEHPTYSYSIDLRVHPDNTNYFKVNWDSSSYPDSSNSCGNSACLSVYRGCLCDIDIIESRVFSSLPTESEILSQLHIGAFDPQSLGSYTQVLNTGSLQVWHKNGGYNKDTIFRIDSYRGKEVYLRNMLSTVQIKGATQYSFRNPPSFLNIAQREPRDAMYETEAVLENYVYHNNVAPFLAMRLIQRFGISNPSPRYIEAVATAFSDGTFPHPNPLTDEFGDGKYGNLEAMVAAIVLDPESRSVIVDADPTSGSLIEPMVKLMRLMRAMDFKKREEAGERLRLVDLQSKIGQEPHSSPSVFSFFQPEYAAPGHIKAASITSPEAQIMSGPKIIGILNGFISLVDLGLTDCYSGFGSLTTWWCGGFEDYHDISNDQFTRGSLKYLPSSNNAASVVDELTLLLTGGRLNSSSRTLIINAYNSAVNNAVGLKVAQKLITATPEFHSTNLVDANSEDRPEMETPEASGDRYKAVVFLMLDGGIDSFNVLVPHSGCSGGQTSYEHYSDVRGGISIPQDELHQINASGSSQVCSTFGIHPKLPYLKSLYDDGDLLWMANMGVLQEPVTKDNWIDKTDKTALFAHNIQYDEVHKMDIFDQQAGRGVGGRMVDVLLKNGVNAGTVSVSGIADTLVSNSASLFVLDPRIGFEKLNPITWTDSSLTNSLKDLNKATNLGSGLFSETWSNLFFQAVGENELLYEALRAVELSTEFPSTYLAKQMEVVTMLTKSKETRGTDRDVFYIEYGGFDTHDNIKERLDERTEEMNDALEAFTTEIKAQGSWDDVTIIMVSEFARTLAGNTGAGSDHAWGGNYFIAGGEVDGKRIIGSYPDVLSDEGPLVFKPGIVIPSLSWDSGWNGIAQWFGITNTDDLDEVLPNRNKFTNDLFHANDLYTTTLPTSSPTSDGGGGACIDSPFRFKLVKDNGKKISRDCNWAATQSTNYRCSFQNVKEHCPSTCKSCLPCVDAPGRFKFPWKGKKITRDCRWVSNKQTSIRCAVSGMENTCRETCEMC